MVGVEIPFVLVDPSNMNVDKLFQEALGGLWNNANYGGFSDPPRKDFAPVSSAQGYDFPYQKNAPPIFPPVSPSSDNPNHPAWPLENVTKDLADSFTYLVAAGNKMENCLRLNKAIKGEQREHLDKLLNFAGKVLGAIEILNMEVVKTTDLLKTLPPTNPHQERNPNQVDVPRKDL